MATDESRAPTRRTALGLMLLGAGGAAAVVYGLERWGSSTLNAGLFATEAELTRARSGGALLDAFLARATRARETPPADVVDDDPETMGFGMDAPRGEPAPEGTLAASMGALRRETDRMRDLALAFRLTGDAGFAESARAGLATWARAHAPIDMRALDLDPAAGSFRGMTDGRQSERPWPFALGAMWQCYGLINAADAAMLLRYGDALPPGADAVAIDAWIARLTEAVAASLRAWTGYAQANPAPDARWWEIYRTGNILTWAMAGMLAGSAALEDAALAVHAIEGAPWRSDDVDATLAGPNPTPLRDIWDRAIEGGEGPERGRIFEERIGRKPPIGYALYHLEAMTLAARIADLHWGVDLWTYEGEDGAGLLDAYLRYVDFVLGERPSPDAGERAAGKRWHFALTPDGFGGAERARLLSPPLRRAHQTHAVGPIALLFQRGR